MQSIGDQKEERKSAEQTQQSASSPVAAKVEEQKAEVAANIQLHGEPQWPSAEWFKKWKETLYIANIKACISHTYNKAMAYRNQLIEEDGTYSSN